MKWLFRCMSIFILSIFFSIALFFTHAGNIFLWKTAKNWLPQLQGEIIKGHIGKGLIIKNLGWNHSLISFKTEKLTITLQPLALLNNHLSISQLEIIKPSITQSNKNDIDIETQNNSTETHSFSAPLSIIINNISITEGEFTNKNMRISFNKLTTSLEINNNGLAIDTTLIEKFNIQTTNNSSEPPTNYNATLEQHQTKIPQIKLPLPVKIKELELTDSQYKDETISNISLSCIAKESTITLHYLNIDHSLTSAQLLGNINLEEDYPLDLTINAILKQKLIAVPTNSQNIAINASLTGSLSELHTTITAQGPVNAIITATINPVKPHQPFDIHLTWDTLQWPLTDNNPEIRTKKGDIRIKGDLTDYQFNMESSLATKNQIPLDITLKGKGDTQHLSIHNSICKTTKGSASLEGKLSWNKNIKWEGHTYLKNLNPSIWISKLPGQLNGKITHHFNYKNQQWNLDIPEILINGHLRNYPIKISGAANINSNMHCLFKDLIITAGSNTITTNGHLDNSWNLLTTLNGPNLKQLYPGLTGSINGKIQLIGSNRKPSANCNIEIPSITYHSFSITDLHCKGSIEKDTEYKANITLKLHKLHDEHFNLQNLQFNAYGVESNHRITLSSQGTPIAADIALAGSWNGSTWQGSLKQAYLKTKAANWTLKEPLPITLDSEKNILLSSQCWQSNKAELYFKSAEISKNHGNVEFTLKHLDLNTLKQIYPKHIKWHAKLSGQGQFQWASNQPKLSLYLTTTPGIIETETQQSHYDIFDIHVDINEQKFASKLRFQSQKLGKTDVKFAISDIGDKRLLSGELNMQAFMLSVISPFIPETKKAEGILSAQGKFAGSITKPLFYGDLSLKDGEVQINQEIAKIQNLNTKIKVNGDLAVISGKMDSGKGSLDFGGNLNWEQLPPTGQVTLKGNNLEIHYPGVGKIQIQPDLAYTFGKNQRITGSISIPWARIRIEGLSHKAVARSKDVIIMGPSQNAANKVKLTDPMNIDVKLIVGNDVHLDAFGLKTNLEGSIRVIQTPKSTIEGHGSIKLKDGRYRYLGQSLIINKGKIILSGPIDDPYLMLKAIRSPDTIDDEVTVGILANGPTSHPKWELFSDPSMSQDQQLSYLLRGRALESTKGDNVALETLLLGLGVSSAGGVVENIGESVGIKEANIDTTGSGEDTQVAISGYISPRTQIQYGVGVFNSISEVKIKYDLMPKLYLQAVNGLGQALDIFYQFSL